MGGSGGVGSTAVQGRFMRIHGPPGINSFFVVIHTVGIGFDYSMISSLSHASCVCACPLCDA
eukprot:7558-Eustigmatos_ZCMA.PRE.1